MTVALKPGLSLTDRILSSVQPDLNSGCWIWEKQQSRLGYGNIKIERKKVEVHRASYAAFNGPIPAGKCVLHKCDTPLCCNPDHLYVGTMSDNAKDRVRRNRSQNNKAILPALPPEKVARILEAFASGLPKAVIARTEGVTTFTVRKYVSQNATTP